MNSQAPDNTQPEQQQPVAPQPIEKKGTKISSDILKRFRRKNYELHPYYPLVIVFVICAVLGSVAICVLPDREPRPLQHWRGISIVADSMITFVPETSFSVLAEFELPTAFTAVDENGLLVCGGGKNGENCKIVHYSNSGEILARIAIPALPTDILLCGESPHYAGKILVAYRYGVWVYDWRGHQLQVISAPVPMAPEKETFVAAIAVLGDHLFMADALQEKVYRFNTAGECDLVIGKGVSRDEAGNLFPGFAADGLYFDMVAGPDETIIVASPKNNQVAAFRSDGTWLPSKSWAKKSYSFQSLYESNSTQFPLDEFFVGNPISIASLRDGRVITTERVVNHVKVFSAAGDFLAYVTPPEFFSDEQSMLLRIKQELLRQEQSTIWFPTLVVDVLPSEKIMVLDQSNQTVHLFSEK